MADEEVIDAGVKPGEVLAGKYRVEHVLGAGGMGVVVAAHHLQLDEKVAIKLLLPSVAALSEVLARFEREARAAVKIKSEHVARVSDVGRLESGAPFMVMEYLEGSDLRAWLTDRGPMSVAQASEFVLQACEAIAEAHALGIVHRDLKPANLFCIKRADGLLSIKVLDFGISKVGASATTAPFDMTSTGAVVGSPAYMSPEQLKAARNVDHRTDIWSLGVILYELVTGCMPFEAEALTELAIVIATTDPPPLSRHRPGIPSAFEAAVMRCLEKDRERRTQNVGELALALREHAPEHARHSVDRILRTTGASSGTARQPPPSRPIASEIAPTVAVGATQLSASTSSGGGADPRARKRGRAIVGAVVALLAGGGLLLAMHGLGRAPKTLPSVASAPSEGSPVAASPSATVPVAPESPAEATRLVPSSPSTSPPAAPAPPEPSRPPPSTRPPKPGASPSAHPKTTGATQASSPPSPSPSCRIVTEYDSEGQPHFKKACD